MCFRQVWQQPSRVFTNLSIRLMYVFRITIFILGVGVICHLKGAWRHRARPPIGTFDPHANVGRKRMSQFSLVRSAADMAIFLHQECTRGDGGARLSTCGITRVCTVSAVAIVA